MAMPSARTEPPMARARSRDALICTVEDLSQQAALIISQIEEAGEPAIITRDGRFIAVITPLGPGQVESVVFPEIARQVAERGRD
jgi:antitoxin (DNA-binding transcriptional repressor) of toxin-antitoxin stability system